MKQQLAKRTAADSALPRDAHSATTSSEKKLQIDQFDSSDEEDLRNTIGNIPVKWYDEYGHVGYDLEGQKIAKPEGAQKPRDEIDTFLQREEDPDYWHKVFDHQMGGEIVLSDEQVGKLNAIAANRYPEIGYNPYMPFLDLFSSQREIHPISNRPPDKRSFVPSADERRIVGRMVHAIKMGWMKKRDPPRSDDDEEEEEHEEVAIPKAYDLWANDGEEEGEGHKSKSELSRLRMHLPAPKVKPPGHAESYNPPPEFLFDEAERKKWEQTEPEKRRLDFVPQKYDALRKIPFYARFYEERLERCLDLHLAPRQRKQRLTVDPNQLLPDLPNPKDLQPFPTTLAFYMRGHSGQVRSLSVEPEFGELLVSGGADSTVRVWLLSSGKCLRVFEMPAPVTCVAYYPDPTKTLVLVSCECDELFVLNVECGDKLAVSATRQFLDSLPLQAENTAAIGWSRQTTGSESSSNNMMDALRLKMHDKIRSVAWHRRGDYFASVGFEQTAGTVVIHQLSKCTSQKPFNKRKGFIQCVLFHPAKPLFFVGTRQHVLVYDLAKCELKRRLLIGTKWLSCMQLHPGGENLFIGGLDCTFAWMDLELSTKPWKKLRNHQSAIRSMAYHRRYPLLATVSDDSTAIVYHARVSADLMRDNELVPVKRLFGHKFMAKRELARLKEATKLEEEAAKEKNADDEESGAEGDSGDEEGKAAAKRALSNERLAILCAVFHPSQPWLVTSGADGQIALFSY